MEKTLGSWLGQKLKEEHLSLREASEKTGVNHQTINSIIKGNRALADTVVKLACAFAGEGNERKALTDELLALAGYRIRGTDISLPMAKLLDIVSDFPEAKILVVIAFAEYLAERNDTELSP